MNENATAPTRNAPRTRIVKSGSVQIRIFENLNRGKPCFTVYWRIGEKPYRKLFADPAKAESFAREQAERLAAGQVNAPAISVAEAQTFREAVRRLGPHDIPLHVVADEYASAVEKLRNAGTLHQAVEFFCATRCGPKWSAPSRR
jgi:hypothetical protein